MRRERVGRAAGFADIRCDGPSMERWLPSALGIGSSTRSQGEDVAWHGGSYDAGTPLLWEMTSIAVIIVLAPMLSSRYGGCATRRVGRGASDWRWR